MGIKSDSRARSLAQNYTGSALYIQQRCRAGQRDGYRKKSRKSNDTGPVAFRRGREAIHGLTLRRNRSHRRRSRKADNRTRTISSGRLRWARRNAIASPRLAVLRREIARARSWIQIFRNDRARFLNSSLKRKIGYGDPISVKVT